MSDFDDLSEIDQIVAITIVTTHVSQYSLKEVPIAPAHSSA